MKYIYTLLMFCAVISLQAQQLSGFTIVKKNDATSIKNQSRSGTCWSFAAVSFIESELLRQGKPPLDLSEMYIARMIYQQKATMYVRMMGHSFFTAGGQPHDVMNAIRDFGIVPEGAYSGRIYGERYHNHARLDSAAKKFVVGVTKKKGKHRPANWPTDFSAILDAHLGTIPQSFVYQGKRYTPQSYAKTQVGLNTNDYITLTSYNHHPFYQPFCLESRYNWSFGLYHNVPLSEFMQTIDYALGRGYTLVWNGDVTEKTFKFRSSLATIPGNQNIDQQMRQASFDNHATTVDHVMHIVGIAQKGKEKYYIVKNSWGTRNQCGGYMYLSEGFIKLKTVSLMLHKKALPKTLKKKLKL
ncbi:C1 family peptidase [uncultured Microscilla sp.]|uniref:C1 family peptidase n=1 Tax=uncultured Microscilla sp. TaxID=432653 RepID=UPI0026237396|nr:C1 family peptidase [uncultured Microscilla sp.]